ncbi:MAG: hypothetical protein ACI4J0_05695 [Huintestinicola sp.]|uniref:hypothetical protein n=1 Tax=Huintestinicola sp. TaxID=2981661 RepID=UPI003F025564
MMRSSDRLEKQVLGEIDRRSSPAGLSRSELFGNSLMFGKKFSQIGTYVYSDMKGYHIVYVNIHGVEGKEDIKEFEELILRLIWDGLIDMSYRKSGYKAGSEEMALGYMKLIDEEYYNRKKGNKL